MWHPTMRKQLPFTVPSALFPMGLFVTLKLSTCHLEYVSLKSKW